MPSPICLPWTDWPWYSSRNRFLSPSLKRCDISAFFSDLCYRKDPFRSCTPTSETSCLSHNTPSTIGFSQLLLFSFSAAYFQPRNSNFAPAMIYVASLTNSHKSSSEFKDVTNLSTKEVLTLSATI